MIIFHPHKSGEADSIIYCHLTQESSRALRGRLFCPRSCSGRAGSAQGFGLQSLTRSDFPIEGGGGHSTKTHTTLCQERPHYSSDSGGLEPALRYGGGGRGRGVGTSPLLVQIQRGDPRFSQEGPFFNQLFFVFRTKVEMTQ